MKTFSIILCFQVFVLAFANGQKAPGKPSVPDSEIAKTSEYEAAKSAEKIRDGAAMLVQAKVLVERFPQSALAHKAMADAYFYMNFLDEAAASAQKAILINPKDPIGWRDLGHIRRRQDKPNEAETAYKSAVNVAKSDPTPWADLAMFYGNCGNTALALQCANYASKLLNSTNFDDHNGETPEAWTWKVVAETFCQIKRPGDAITHFKRSIALQPTDYGSWLGLGLAYSLQGDRVNAIAAAEQAVKIAPDSEEAKQALEALAAPPKQQQPPPQQQTLTIEQMQQAVELAKQIQELRNMQQQSESQSLDQMQQQLDLIRKLQGMDGKNHR